MRHFLANDFTMRIMFRLLMVAAVMITLYEVRFVQLMRLKFEEGFFTIAMITSILIGLILLAITRRRRRWLSESERKVGMILGILCEIPLVIIGVAILFAENSPPPA